MKLHVGVLCLLYTCAYMYLDSESLCMKVFLRIMGLLFS